MNLDPLCPGCGARLKNQSGFNIFETNCTCEKCNAALERSYSDNDYRIVDKSFLCPTCGANLKIQYGFNKYNSDWRCDKCKMSLVRNYSNGAYTEIDEKYVCPCCKANFKKQYAFSEYSYDFECEECHVKLYREYLSDNFAVLDSKYLCPNCNANLKKQYSYSDCTYDMECEECHAKLHRDYSSDPFQTKEDKNYINYETYSGLYGKHSVGHLPPNNMLDMDIPLDSEDSLDNYLDMDEMDLSELDFQTPEEVFDDNDQDKEKSHFWDIITRKKIVVGISAANLKKMKYDEAIKALEKQGFYKITINDSDDLSIAERSKENYIERIEIQRELEFESTARFPVNSKIFIVRKTLKKANPPISSRRAKNRDVNEIEELFINSGFENVQLKMIPDLKKGWLKRNGSVEKVCIDKQFDYKCNEQYRIDKVVLIWYHTFEM